jgi:hypothetical protein
MNNSDSEVRSIPTSTGQGNDRTALKAKDRYQSTRRNFLTKMAIGSVGLRLASKPAGLLSAAHATKDKKSVSQTIKLMVCDLNFVRLDKPFRTDQPSAPQDWAFVDPKEFLEWHQNFGNNAIHCHAYTFCGYAFYPTKLGAIPPGPGQEFLPRLFEMSRAAGMSFWSSFSVSWDLIMSAMRGCDDLWVVPNSRIKDWYWGNLAPESPWTDLFCARVEEFLRQFPVDGLLFDMFEYGSPHSNEFPVQPAWFVEKPFNEIIGHKMPSNAVEITPTESLAYKREILARQFYRIRDVVRKTSPKTKICFNIPYWRPAEELWVDHPMVNESDILFAESSDAVVEWLLNIRKPHQRVMTTIIGRADLSDPNTWRKWHERGCDFYGYAWGTPPDFRPHPSYAADLDTIRRAFREIRA